MKHFHCRSLAQAEAGQTGICLAEVPRDSGQSVTPIAQRSCEKASYNGIWATVISEYREMVRACRCFKGVLKSRELVSVVRRSNTDLRGVFKGAVVL